MTAEDAPSSSAAADAHAHENGDKAQLSEPLLLPALHMQAAGQQPSGPHSSVSPEKQLANAPSPFENGRTSAEPHAVQFPQPLSNASAAAPADNPGRHAENAAIQQLPAHNQPPPSSSAMPSTRVPTTDAASPFSAYISQAQSGLASKQQLSVTAEQQTPGDSKSANANARATVNDRASGQGVLGNSQSSRLPPGAIAVPTSAGSATVLSPTVQPPSVSAPPPHVLAHMQQQVLIQQMQQQQQQAQQHRLHQQHSQQQQQQQHQQQLPQPQHSQQQQPAKQQHSLHSQQRSQQQQPMAADRRLNTPQLQAQQQQQADEQPAQTQQQQQQWVHAPQHQQTPPPQPSQAQGYHELSQMPILQQQMLLRHQLQKQQHAAQAGPAPQQAQQASFLPQQARFAQQGQQDQHAQQTASLQQQSSLTRPSMQLLSGGLQQPRFPVALQPRGLQPTSGWPVPLPKAMSGNVGVGIKRSASGESGAGNAKKQKTALATYQQAQEHIRAQQARQGAQGAAQKKLAEDLFHSLAPSLGPLLSLPADFATTHAKEIEMALRSGLNSSLAWSLNALTILSFKSQHPLLIENHPGILQGLLQVMTAGLDEVPPVPPDPAECFTAAEALLPGKVPQRKPGELQDAFQFTRQLLNCHCDFVSPVCEGWWWEREPGLLAPQEGAGWGFSHASCACNVLRNLAMERDNHAVLAGQAVVSALTACLAACQQAPCPDSNLLASDALDVLHKIGAQLSLPGLPPEVPSALLSQLCRALDPQSSPLRLRLTATGALHKMVMVEANREALGEAVGNPDTLLLSHLNSLLRLDVREAQHEVERELKGSFGAAQHAERELLPKEVYAAALAMQAHCLAEAAKTVRELAQGSTGRAAVARHEHVMFSLIQLLLSTHLQDRLDWHKSSTRERLKDGLHLHIFHNLKTALQYCTAALITLAMEPEGRSKLQSYESHLAEVAMTDLPQAEWIAVLLYKVFCSGVHSRRPV